MSTPTALLVKSFTSVTHRAFYTDRSGIFMRSGFIGIISFIKHSGGQWQSHAGASKKQHLRITWDSSHKVYHRQESSPRGWVGSIFCAEQRTTGCDAPALPGTGGGHSVHMCFFSSRNAHQALPFALFRAAHILLLAH